VDLSEITTGSSGGIAGDCIPVKRAIESVFQAYGIQDLVRVTRSDFSDIHGQYVITASFGGVKYHRFLNGPKDAKAVAEGVMAEFERDYPGQLPTRPAREP
jgi:hypothetical protein